MEKVAPYATISGESRILCLYLVASYGLIKIMESVNIGVASRTLWCNPQSQYMEQLSAYIYLIRGQLFPLINTVRFQNEHRRVASDRHRQHC